MEKVFIPGILASAGSETRGTFPDNGETFTRDVTIEVEQQFTDDFTVSSFPAAKRTQAASWKGSGKIINVA